MNALAPPDLSYRWWRVLQRHWDVQRKQWRTESWPPFAEALMSLVAFGLGLGAYVSGIAGEDYIRFLAPGLIVQAVLFAASFETTYGSYFRMENQHTFEAMIATPVSIEDVITGDILLAAVRGSFATACFMAVVALFGLWSSPWAILLLPAAFLAGLMFGALGMIFTAVTPSISAYNFYISLFITPNLFFGGVFFPTDQFPEAVKAAIWVLPASHVAPLFRAVARGDFGVAFWVDLAWIVIVTGVAFYLALGLMRRRLIK